MKYLIYILLIVICAIGCKPKKSALPYFNSLDFTPQFLSKAEADHQISHTIPAFAFTDQDGKAITSQQVKGRIYVADFFFTKCGSICPLMTSNMKLVADSFKNDNHVLFLSHSVTPETDNIPALKAYAELKNIKQPNWHLLTGNKAEIYTIARQGYFADERTGVNKDTTDFLHTENFILVDRQGRIRGVYNGTLQVEAIQLVKHIRLLEAED